MEQVVPVFWFYHRPYKGNRPVPLEDFIITVFCWIADIYAQLVDPAQFRRRGFAPSLSDEEVITMEIIGEFLGIDADKGICRYFKSHWNEWFPSLGSRQNFAKQAASLWNVKQRIQQQIVVQLYATEDKLHIADGFPVPVCHFKRASFSKTFKGSASYGFCASKGETYYGFKGNVMISSEGIITDITLSAANVDERASLWDIVRNISGIVFADKGLNGVDLQRELKIHEDINLQTPVRKNRPDTRGKDAQTWLISTRRLVETVIGQLTEQFNIQKVRARSLWHLTNRITRKVLSHTMAVMINKSLGNPPLQFEKLVLMKS